MPPPSKLKTLHINTARGWRGGEQQTFFLMDGLRRRGHGAEAVCQPGEECARRLKAAGFPVHEVRMRGEWDVLAARRVGRLMADGGFDVCHMHTAHAHMVGALALWFCRRRPAMLVSRRVDFSLHKAPFRLSRLKYSLGADHFLTVSEFIRGVMIADGVPSGKITAVRSCQDPARFQGVAVGDPRRDLGMPEGAPVLGNVAALVGHKGQKYLLGAMPRILEEIPGLVLVILGEGELRGALEEQAERLGIGESVVFAGFREDVLCFYALFDVFAMSSVMEGLGTALLDAMGMSCPIVATNAGGIPEVVRDGVNGILVEKADPDALAEGVLRMFRDEGLRRRCVEGGRKTLAEEFSADRLVEGTLGVYWEVIGGK